MADNRQLKTTRLANATAGNQIDDAFSTFEEALEYIFGITDSTPYSQAMSIDASGNVQMIGTLTLSGDPSVALGAATKQYVDNLPAGGALERLVLAADSTNNVTNGSENQIFWTSALVQTDPLSWSDDPWAERDRIKIINTGKYLLGFQTNASHYGPTEDFGLDIRIKKNGSAYHGKPFILEWNDDSLVGYGSPVSGQIILSLTAGDYLQIMASIAAATDDMTLTNCRAWLLRIA